MTSDERSQTRRKALQTIFAGGSIGLAGCQWNALSNQEARNSEGQSNMDNEGSSPARRLISVPMRKFTFWDRLTYTALQGIANRAEPRIYLDAETLLADHDIPWKSWYSSEYGWSFTRVGKPRRVFDRDWPIEGYVVVDREDRQTANIAANYAATEDLLPVTEPFLESVSALPDLPIEYDLRGQFRDWGRDEVYEWAYENQWPEADHGIVANVYLDGFRTQGIRDFVIANRGFCFELSSDPNLTEQYEIRDRYLGEMTNPGYVMGWATHGDLDDEGQYVAHGSKHGTPIVMSQRMENLTVHQQVPVGDDLSVPAPDPKQDDQVKEKIYVTFVISDGDALGALHDHYFFNWQDVEHGNQPLGWSMQPLLLDLAPGMLEYYVEHAGENEEFVAESGSIGYTFPSHVPADDLPGLLQETKSYLERMNLHTLTVLGGGQKTMAATYDDILGDQLHGVMSGYVDRGYEEYILDSLIWSPTELPDRREESFLDSLRRIADRRTTRPQFVPIHVPITVFEATDAERVSKALDEDQFEVVGPNEFYRTFRAYRDTQYNLVFDFNKTVSPGGNRQLAFAIDSLELVSRSGNVLARYDIGTGRSLPMDGGYSSESDGTRSFRWFGMDRAEAVFLMEAEVVSNAVELRIVGRPPAGGISADVSLQGEYLDELSFEAGWKEYQLSLQW